MKIFCLFEHFIIEKEGIYTRALNLLFFFILRGLKKEECVDQFQALKNVATRDWFPDLFFFTQ